MDSILTSIKKQLGIAEDYKYFDADLIIHINSVFTILQQLGVGPLKGFEITGEEETWSDFIPNKDPKLNSVKSYIFMKVKLMFDPPLSTMVIDSYQKLISELEWRLNVAVDPGNYEEGEEVVLNAVR